MSAKLIITCDDVGMHSSINEAAEQAAECGVITNMSVVANGEKFAEAARITKKYPGISVGLHFNIIEGIAVSPDDEVESLLVNKQFYNSHFQFLKDMAIGKIDRQHIRNELRAQINKCREHGIDISHIDGHRHLHLFPSMLKTITPVLKAEGLNKLRFVNVPVHEYIPGAVTKCISSLLLKYSSRFAARQFTGPDYFLGFFNSGRISLKLIKEWFVRFRDNQCYEIGMHLGMDDGVLERAFPWDSYYDYSFSWKGELEALLHEETRSLLAGAERVQLMNYQKLT